MIARAPALLGALMLTAGCGVVGTAEPQIDWLRHTPAPAERVKSGTGFFVAGDGLLATSAHVISGCKRVSIWPRYGGPYTGDVVPSERDTEIALLSTGHQVPRYARVVHSPKVRVGTRVWTLGYGVIASEPRRPIVRDGVHLGVASTSTGLPLFWLRASLDNGNSGGAVIDANDRLVGMVVGRSADQPDRGLAVPSAEIEALLSAAGIRSIAEPVELGPKLRPADFLIAISALVQCQPDLGSDHAQNPEIRAFASPVRSFGWFDWLLGYGR